MDEIIEGIREVLYETQEEQIANLLADASHEVIGSGTYGSRLHSIVSTLLIKSSPKKVALLNQLTEEKRQKIIEAALLFYPIQDNSPEIREILFKAIPNPTNGKIKKVSVAADNSLVTGRTYCIITAVENYSNIADFSKVDYAEKDAKDFLESLKMLGLDPDYLSLLVDSQATRSSIIQKVKYYSELAGENDRLIFYFAGHGFYEGGKNLLASFDAVKIDKLETCVAMDQILAHLNRSKCQNSLLFIDCCHSGFDFSGYERDGEDSFSADDLIYQFRQEQFCIGFASCKSNQRSISHPNLKNGVWSHFLNKALRGEANGIYEKNLLFSDRLQDYLKEQTSEYVKNNTEKRKEQTPVKFGIETNKFIVADISKLTKKSTGDMIDDSYTLINNNSEVIPKQELYKVIRKGERILVHVMPNIKEEFVIQNGIDYNFDTLNIRYNKKYSDLQLTFIFFDANGTKISYPITLNESGTMAWLNDDPVENPNFGFIGFTCEKDIFFEFSFY